MDSGHLSAQSEPSRRRYSRGDDDGRRIPGFAAGIPTGEPLEEVVVTAKRVGLIGESQAASEGIVSSVQLEGRPILRPGEVLEVVPGLVVTQHSGDGKANQYFLRGFNLDHGTDFASYVDGVPVNMPTHAHGQGYADINFLIHELVDEVHYRKGPYYAEEGNFSAAGAARVATCGTLARRRSASPSARINTTACSARPRRWWRWHTAARARLVAGRWPLEPAAGLSEDQWRSEIQSGG